MAERSQGKSFVPHQVPPRSVCVAVMPNGRRNRLLSRSTHVYAEIVTDDELYRLFGKTPTHEIPARELRAGDVVRIEAPASSGQGFTALTVDAVDTSAAGMVAVRFGKGHFVVEYSSSNPNHQIIDLDSIEEPEVPRQLSFDADAMVTVELAVSAA